MSDESCDFNLTKETKDFLLFLKNANLPPIETVEPSIARIQYEALIKLVGGYPVPIEHVRNLTINSLSSNRKIPLRIYAPSHKKGLPSLVYYHGGGWVKGNHYTHDRMCRKLAVETQAVVISVEYALSPENKFPAAIEDAYDSLLWAIKNIHGYNGDSQRIAVIGDSSGGNIAAVIAHMAAKNELQEVQLQVLLYPVIDCACNTPSYTTFENGFMLTKKSMEYYIDSYLEDANLITNPQVSPLHFPFNEQLAPAIIITAEADPLRDEARLYADRLAQKDLLIQYNCYPGVIHAFMQLPGVFPEADRSLVQTAGLIRSVFETPARQLTLPQTLLPHL